ncbi:TnsA endonuclease N-terminal domain-containing protein [uncultured Microbulbifer sp.]|uniref:TnsA endonuclease N-terminal domain-containing protein n=1 Tax=uncultured Microbulbifer sp. TaxID=348147 RepID=UPI002632804B|nr:TnsA endonuclease N-terminal domain-containing protein [uncultured Microbulbifer sp.]
MRRQPARKIKASAVKNIFKFPSTKSFAEPSHQSYQMVLVESMLEKDYCFHLEANPNVLRYFPQPKTFVINSELLKNRDYTPDFEVHFRGGRKAYVEVKKDFNSLDAVYLHKLEMAAIKMRQAGYEFVCVDESQIRIQPLLENLRKLQRYRDRFTNNSGTLMLLRDAVPHPKNLKDLIANPLGIRLETIYKLIANGQIAANLSAAHLSLDAEVHYA